MRYNTANSNGDLDIIDCESNNSQHNGKPENMRMKAAYGMSAEEYNAAFGINFWDDYRNLYKQGFAGN